MRDPLQARMQIVAALESLLQNNRSIASIRVTDLCKQCGISRSVFYYHFSDIFEVATWMWDHLMSNSLYKVGSTLTWYEAHYTHFLKLLQYRKLFIAFFQGNESYSVVEYGFRSAKQNIIERAEEVHERKLSEQELFELDYFVRAAAAMTKKWAIEGMTIPPEQMAKLYESYIPAFVRVTLNGHVKETRKNLL